MHAELSPPLWNVHKWRNLWQNSTSILSVCFVRKCIANKHNLEEHTHKQTPLSQVELHSEAESGRKYVNFNEGLACDTHTQTEGY